MMLARVISPTPSRLAGRCWRVLGRARAPLAPQCPGPLWLLLSEQEAVLEITRSLPGPSLLSSNFYFLSRNNQGVIPRALTTTLWW